MFFAFPSNKELAASHPSLRHGEEAPIDRLIQPVVAFLRIESLSGILLFIFALVAVGLANSPWSESFHAFWQTEVGFAWNGFAFELTMMEWINDGLMTIFFFVVGLEIKREIVTGELRDWRSAILPIAAALGGMVFPALVFLTLQRGEPGEAGWGIPMATDIAFVVGTLTLLGKRVPQGLKLFLLTLAIVDDLGAILVIAIFYSGSLAWGWLVVGAVGMVAVMAMQRLGVWSIPFYIVAGAVVWYGIYHSGIHPTIAGVLLGLATPTVGRLVPNRAFEYGARQVPILPPDEVSLADVSVQHKLAQLRRMVRLSMSPLERLETALHGWVALVVLPIFALANAGLTLEASSLGEPLAWAVAVGLLVGKPLGILVSAWFVVATRIVRLPSGLSWPVLAGGACLGGIGFTMSLFVSSLAFRDDLSLLSTAKLGVLLGSVASAMLGVSILAAVLYPRDRVAVPV